MKLVRVALLGVGIAAIVAFAGVGRPDRARGDTGPTRSITVSGSGSATATPTQAVMTFGVSSKAKTAVQALSDNSTAMRRVLDALKGAGVPAAALQTQTVSLSADTSDDGQTILGYSATNSVAATIAVARAGQIVDVAVAAGANEVDGPSLAVADQTSLYHEALRAAIADARAKAQVLADAGGLHVGAVTSVEESGGSSPVTYAQAAVPATGTPVEPGTQQVTASVTVVFDAS